MTTQSIAPYVLINTYKADPDTYHTIEDLLTSRRSTDDQVPRSVYKDQAESHFIEILGLSSLTDLDSYLTNDETRNFESKIGDNLSYDIRREVLRQQDIVKPTARWIPSTDNLQMRYIEVPLYLLDEYHNWRQDTIFANVSKRDEINGFTAYHSVISQQPGVTFFVEFDCTPDELHEGFQSDEYKQIVKDANTYIIGGNQNLYTRFYTNIFTSYNNTNKQAVA